MKPRLILGLLATTVVSGLLFGQAPVVGVADPASLFTDKDPILNKNKQAAMHIVIDLLAYGHWSDGEKWLTERYIQHNPNIGSGRAPVLDFFTKNSKAQPIPANSKDWSTKIVAVTTQGKDVVCVASVMTLPDPRTPGKTYTTTHFDMWRFVDGKADEHWDEGAIAAPPSGQGKAKQ